MNCLPRIYMASISPLIHSRKRLPGCFSRAHRKASSSAGSMSRVEDYDAVICGAGSIGVSAAYYMSKSGNADLRKILLIDKNAPLSQTSSKSGENFRAWWPHPVIAQFVERSLDLMDDLAKVTDNCFSMTHTGYLYAFSSEDNLERMIESLARSGRVLRNSELRMHGMESRTYEPTPGCREGADILRRSDVIREHYPALSPNIEGILHLRRAGSISAAGLGNYLLSAARRSGVSLLNAEVTGVEISECGTIELTTRDGAENKTVRCRCLINAAGPFSNHVNDLLGSEALPVSSTFQQKIMFEDTLQAVPRDLPFSILAESQKLNWLPEEVEALHDAGMTHLTQELPGGVHLKPDGGEHAKWVKLGWALNTSPEDPSWDPLPTDVNFVDILLRGASALVPEMSQYTQKMRKPIHYGGYYTQTLDHLPLVGPLEVPGCYIASGFAGYGTMASLAAGELLERHISRKPLPPYAESLSPVRMLDQDYVASLERSKIPGEL